MLSCEDFRRGHQHTLTAALNRTQKSEEGHQCFSSTHIPLQKPVHPLRTGHILSDFSHGALLCSRGFVGQRRQYAGLQLTVAGCGAALFASDLG